ncbi:unnamed protein product [Camellia sinensis]
MTENTCKDKRIIRYRLYLLLLDCVSDSYERAMSNQASDKVTLNDKISSTRTSIVQGEESGGGSSSHDRPMAIADQHSVQLSVVIESHPTPQPQPKPQPYVRDVFRSSIMNVGAKSGETGESSKNTKHEQS